VPWFNPYAAAPQASHKSTGWSPSNRQEFGKPPKPARKMAAKHTTPKKNEVQDPARGTQSLSCKGVSDFWRVNICGSVANEQRPPNETFRISQFAGQAVRRYSKEAQRSVVNVIAENAIDRAKVGAMTIGPAKLAEAARASSSKLEQAQAAPAIGIRTVQPMFVYEA
jgi:hypothetical protein